MARVGDGGVDAEPVDNVVGLVPPTLGVRDLRVTCSGSTRLSLKWKWLSDSLVVTVISLSHLIIRPPM